ncbi:hypothetical protein LCGC14_0645970 [marine sediment metagenome]|uniref:Uncharacterized protein n=1 Tax=marine sediment metagenome TaxID=412755 RepID=A0A0F9U637_9ZZZZ|nr:hypothetical protein [Candidatus Aminicenantes bacterium]
MSKQKKIPLILIFFFVLSPFLLASEKILINLEGNYLAYSYDYRQIYGENVKFEFSLYEVSCQYIKIDVASRTFYAYGNIVLKKENEIISGDEFLFDPKKNIGKLISYKEGVEIKKIGDEGSEIALSKNNILDELSLSKIKKSFIYFTGKLFQINKNFEIYGFNVGLYLEGIESIGFKKFKLSGGFHQRRNGISLNRIWYTRSQGIIGRLSYLYEKEKKINTITQLNYEEHSVLKDYSGLKRQIDVMSSTTINFNENLNLGLTGNYNSGGLWNTRLWLNKKWSNKVNTQVDVLYNKPINLQGEAWVGFQSNINANKFGNISFVGKYGIQNQVLSNISYRNTFLKKINFLLSSSYSKVKIGRNGDYSKIFSGGINLSYSSRIFNLSTDYYLNYDLFGDQLLSQPQLRLGLNPFNFFGGLLSASIYNIFIYNNLNKGEIHEDNYSNNTVFNLSTKPIFVQKSFSLNFNIALEQFVEKEGRNFTSGGFIVNANKGLIKGVSVGGLYNIQSRRKTKSWLIEGTTSQNLSAVLKVNPSKRLNGWVSFSFDPKNSTWRQSFVDVSIELFRNWKFHSLLNYDFILKKINNVDLYIIREAGQFQLRFVWRSLSKQFMVELVPR